MPKLNFDSWNLFITCPYCCDETATEEAEILAFERKQIPCPTCSKSFSVNIKTNKDGDWEFKSFAVCDVKI
jgi:hypothetical protein